MPVLSDTPSSTNASLEVGNTSSAAAPNAAPERTKYWIFIDVLSDLT
jgi:hypothetical protein